jgi:hypothetical protein
MGIPCFLIKLLCQGGSYLRETCILYKLPYFLHRQSEILGQRELYLLVCLYSYVGCFSVSGTKFPQCHKVGHSCSFWFSWRCRFSLCHGDMKYLVTLQLVIEQPYIISSSVFILCVLACFILLLVILRSSRNPWHT